MLLKSNGILMYQTNRLSKKKPEKNHKECKHQKDISLRNVRLLFVCLFSSSVHFVTKGNDVLLQTNHV